MIVLLDAGPLGYLSNPRDTPHSKAAREWTEGLVKAEHRVLIPAIADYEVRRELTRTDNAKSLAHLDGLRGLGFVPLSDEAMRQACRFWAAARNSGIATADLHALDGDVILAAQAHVLDPSDWGKPGSAVVVATTNVKHLTRFIAARDWRSIHAAES